LRKGILENLKTLLKIEKCKKFTCNSSMVERTNVNVERRTIVREKIAKPLNSNKKKMKDKKHKIN